MGTPTSVAPAVIVVVRDADGFGPAIADALQPIAGSGITRSESCEFELSLEKYGITDRVAPVDLVQFVHAHGSPHVSILLLPNYDPPIAACAVKEILASVSSQDLSNQTTFVIPLIVKALKALRETNQTVPEHEITLYGAEIGPANEFTQAIISGTVPPPPPSLRVPCEPLAYLLQMTRVLNVSTVLLITSGGQSQHKRSTDNELEALCTLGQSLANRLGLFFAKDRLQRERFEKPKVDQEPWRALYG